MDAPSYEELLTHYQVGRSQMEETCTDHHLTEFGSQLDEWEKLASFLISSKDIEDIKTQGGKGLNGIRLLQYWKQACGFKATYKTLVRALLQIGRTDLAEKVIGLVHSERESVQSPPSPSEFNQVAPKSPASSSGMEDESSTAMSPLSLPATPSEQIAQVTSTPRELDLAEKVITLRQSSRDIPTGLPSLQSPTTSISNTETYSI